MGGTSTFQIVQVVSIEDVPTMEGSVSFQSKEVRGAQNSLFLFCATKQLLDGHIDTAEEFKE